MTEEVDNLRKEITEFGEAVVDLVKIAFDHLGLGVPFMICRHNQVLETIDQKWYFLEAIKKIDYGLTSKMYALGYLVDMCNEDLEKKNYGVFQLTMVKLNKDYEAWRLAQNYYERRLLPLALEQGAN